MWLNSKAVELFVWEKMRVSKEVSTQIYQLRLADVCCIAGFNWPWFFSRHSISFVLVVLLMFFSRLAFLTLALLSKWCLRLALLAAPALGVESELARACACLSNREKKDEARNRCFWELLSDDSGAEARAEIELDAQAWIARQNGSSGLVVRLCEFKVEVTVTVYRKSVFSDA